MTQKQKNLINEMRANNALYADVTYSFKDTPKKINESTIKLKPYNENDPADVENDDNIFFYFQDIDEMVEAMDSSNKDFEFAIHSIIRYSFE